MLLSALGSNSEPVWFIARGGFAIGVWGQAPKGFSGAGEGVQRAAAPNDKLNPIDWSHCYVQCYNVRESPAKSGGSTQLARPSVFLPRKQSRRLANSRTMLNRSLSAWLGSFNLEKER